MGISTCIMTDVALLQENIRVFLHCGVTSVYDVSVVSTTFLSPPVTHVLCDMTPCSWASEGSLLLLRTKIFILEIAAYLQSAINKQNKCPD